MKDDVKKWSRRAAKLGFALGLICHFLPGEYRTVCTLIADVCTGHL